jgi:hypothetical protein
MDLNSTDSVLISHDNHMDPYSVVVSALGEWYKPERWSIEEFTRSRS